MNSQNAHGRVINRMAKKFGFYAIGVIAIQGLKIIFHTAGLFLWFIPFFVTFVIERQNAASLGLVIQREKIFVYSLYAILGLLVLLLVFGLSFYLRTKITGESSDEVIGAPRGIFCRFLYKEARSTTSLDPKFK